MYNFDDLVAKLFEQGFSSEQIMAGTTSAVNKKLAEQEQKKKEEAAKIKAEKAKMEDATAVADLYNSFIKTYYPDSDMKFTGKDIMNTCELYLKTADIGKELLGMFKMDKPETFTMEAVCDPIIDFLKKNDLF